MSQPRSPSSTRGRCPSTRIAGGRRAPLAGLLLSALLLTSCLATAEVSSTVGVVRLAALGSMGAAEVVATISGASAGEFEPITFRLTDSGTHWGASTTSVPAGPGRRFEIAAYDGAGGLLYAGSTSADVSPRQVMSLSILLQAWPPPPTPPPSSTPVIQAVSASPGLVVPGGESWLTVSALNQEQFQYEWRSDCGTFSTPLAPVTAWTAPPAVGPCTLSVTVNDPAGSSSTIYVGMDVQSPVP